MSMIKKPNINNYSRVLLDGVHIVSSASIRPAPTRVLYDMIQQIKYIKNKCKGDELVDLICKRCKTHPEDVNWIDDKGRSPFHMYDSLVVSNTSSKIWGRNEVKVGRALVQADSFQVLEELKRLYREGSTHVTYKPARYFIKKLAPIKSSDLVEVFQKYHLSS